jgi:hypothetical protein
MESHGGMVLTGSNRGTQDTNPDPLPLCPPQIPHG